MVYRYQNALRDDDGLRQKLQFLRPVPRRVMPIALVLICAVPLLLARLEGASEGTCSSSSAVSSHSFLPRDLCKSAGLFAIGVLRLERCFFFEDQDTGAALRSSTLLGDRMDLCISEARPAASDCRKR